MRAPVPYKILYGQGLVNPIKWNDIVGDGILDVPRCTIYKKPAGKINTGRFVLFSFGKFGLGIFPTDQKIFRLSAKVAHGLLCESV